jgi:hypothetical protein
MQGADLSATIDLREDLDCAGSAAASTPGCFTRCTPFSVAAGSCAPGVHTFLYTVADKAGRTAQARVEVVVEQLLVRVYSFEVQACSETAATNLTQALSTATNDTALLFARHYLPQLINLQAAGGADVVRGAAVLMAQANGTRVAANQTAYAVAVQLLVNVSGMAHKLSTRRQEPNIPPPVHMPYFINISYHRHYGPAACLA